MDCKKICFVNIDDVNKWIDDDKVEILACLTWYEDRKLRPPLVLFIPKKKHLKNHKFLGRFYKKEWKENNECIFYHEGICALGKLKPSICLKKETEEDRLDRQKQNIGIYQNRELVSKMIDRAKKQASLRKLTKLVGEYALKLRAERDKTPCSSPKDTQRKSQIHKI